MKANIINNGNSKAIRIPRKMRQLRDARDEADIEGNSIVINPSSKKPREGWSEAFKAGKGIKEKPLIDDIIGLDMYGWNW